MAKVRKALFVGAKIRAASTAAQYIADVRVPGNFTRPDSIEAERQKLLAKREAEAVEAVATFSDKKTYHKPMLGALTSVHVLDDNGVTLFAKTKSNGQVEHGAVASAFVEFLLQECENQFGNSLTGDATFPKRLIFGFGIKDILRIATFELLSKEEDAMVVPVRLWYNPPHVYDPVDIALTAGYQRDLDAGSLLRYCGSKVGTDPATMDAETQAWALRTIVQTLQLLPPNGTVT